MKTVIGRILFAALLIRLLLPIVAFIHTQDLLSFHAADTESYVAPAMGIIKYGRYTNFVDGQPELARTPLLPLMLVPGLLLNSLEPVTIALQIALSCLTVYLVYKIALLVFGNAKIAAISAGMYAIEPLSVLYTSKVLTETLFTSAITLSLYYLLKYLDSGSWKDLIICAVSLAASVYVRPVSYYLPFVIALFLVIWGYLKTPDKKQALVKAGMFFIVSMGIIGAWQVRNSLVAGYPKISSIPAINTYYYSVPAVLAETEGKTFEDIQKRMRETDDKIKCQVDPQKRLCAQKPIKQSDMYIAMQKEGLKILQENRFVYLGIHLKGLLRVVFGPAGSDYARLFGLNTSSHGIDGGAFVDDTLGTAKNVLQKDLPLFLTYLIPGVILYFYLLCALVGFISEKALKSLPLMALVTISAYFIAVSGGAVGQGRYRHPVMPIICILAGYGLSLILNRIKKSSDLTENQSSEV
jgi:4-amino-4-deoxy-L-arabinose transferase-like glycosyltransferase